MKELIQSLVESYGPSGREGPVRELVRGLVEDHADRLDVSTMGSLHAIKNPGGGPKVMLAAHLDEIGVIVSHVDSEGFARFHKLGGYNLRSLVGHRVRFENGAVGIIGVEDPLDLSRSLRLDRLFLDLGSSSRRDCPVQVGDIGGFDRPFVDMGDRLVGKSMDDRIGVAVLVETLRRLEKTPNEVQFAFTVQEEIGRRGARTSAFSLEPDIAVAVDVTRSGDTPRGVKLPVVLGAGPAIKIRDGLMLSDPRVIDIMQTRAKAAGIPHQFEVLESGSTDASVIQLSRAGVPSGGLAIPCRYVHTPSEMVSLSDAEGSVNLLLAILQDPLELD